MVRPELMPPAPAIAPELPGGALRLLTRAAVVLAMLLVVVTAVSLWMGYRPLDIAALASDDSARTAFFRLRLPRVLLGAIVGSSLGIVGAALQAMFRNPLAEPFTLGVSGGGTLGSSIAIALGWGAPVLGIPLVFVAGSAGAAGAVIVAYSIGTRLSVIFPGTILLAGLAINFTATSGVIILQYLADYSRALQILRWTIGSLEIVGFDLIQQMLVLLVPAWLVLLFSLRDLYLIAMGEEVALSLGVDVARCQRRVFLAASLVVGVTVSVGGTIAFVGLVVPHVARILFGEDVRVVMPCSFLLGASFLMGADTVARVAFDSRELPVGAVTALVGGCMFLWLLQRQQRPPAY
jgi:iron complex transport system permease protein